MTDNTKDLSKFGYRELDMAGDLLKAYASGKSNTWEGEALLTDGVAVEFNPNSGNVFLVDEDFNVAMMNGNDKIEMFLTCGNCGVESFASEDENLKSIYKKSECGECLAKNK